MFKYIFLFATLAIVLLPSTMFRDRKRLEMHKTEFEVQGNLYHQCKFGKAVYNLVQLKDNQHRLYLHKFSIRCVSPVL